MPKQSRKRQNNVPNYSVAEHNDEELQIKNEPVDIGYEYESIEFPPTNTENNVNGTDVEAEFTLESQIEFMKTEVDTDEETMNEFHEETMQISRDEATNESWTNDDDRTLVDRVKLTSKQKDNVNYKVRLRQLRWEEIAFKNYTAEECETRFRTLAKKVRHHRNLNEISIDVEKYMKKCPLKKPLNSYQLFIQDTLSNSVQFNHLGAMYKQLSSEQRIFYEDRAKQLLEEYKQKKAEFNSGNTSATSKCTTPRKYLGKTPFVLYASSKKLEESDFKKLRENYANLSLDEKYDWITKAIDEAPDKSEENIERLLDKEELRLWKGQVMKKTPSAFCLFIKETCGEIKDVPGEKPHSKNKFVELSIRWKSLAPEQLQNYKNAAALLKKQAIEEHEAFNKRRGIAPLKTRRRKSVYLKQPSKDGFDQKGEMKQVKEEEEEEVTAPTPTPEWTQMSVYNDSGSDDINTKQIQQKLPTVVQSSLELNVVPMVQLHTKINVTEIERAAKGEKEKKRKKTLISKSSGFNVKVESDEVPSSSRTRSKKKAIEEKTDTPDDELTIKTEPISCDEFPYGME